MVKKKKQTMSLYERLLFLIVLMIITMTIQVWNSLNSVMALPYQAFRNCQKWMLPYKERGSNLDKPLSSYLNIILQSPIKYPMIYPIYLQDQGGGPRVKLPLISRFLIMAFNFGYVYIMFTWFKQNIYIKNSSSHNLTDSFTIHEIFHKLFDCQSPHQDIHLQEKKQVS